MNADSRIVEPGRLEAPAGQLRFLCLPQRELFAERARRFRQLAGGHPLEEYLSFLALLAEAQQDALERLPYVSLPDPGGQALCREHGMPLLAARSLRRDPAWREGLAMILRRMDGARLPAAARETVTGLLHGATAGLEETADRVLASEPAGVPPRELPFIAAALQVYWVDMASRLVEQEIGRPQEMGACPVCGSYPVAGIVHGSGAKRGLRYLCCSLCASQWHMVRVQCSSCASMGGISYCALEGGDGAVKAECCDDCGSYLKLLYLEKAPCMEATADDLATLSLDMLLNQEGKARCGPNLFFHPGGV